MKLIAICALILAALPALAADSAATLRLEQNLQSCANCHAGADPLAPRLGGQQPDYIVKALKAYRSGQREHFFMRGMAASLSAAEMRELAAYYAAQSDTAPAAGRTPAPPAYERCVACHGVNGNQPAGAEIPRLAGQHSEYLEKALGDYIAGNRRDPVMRAQVVDTDSGQPRLSPDEAKALAGYFARQRGLADQ